MFKMNKFAIQNDKGEYFWGMTRRSGYGYEDEDMPKFWEMNDRTVLFDSEQKASDYAVTHNLNMWTHWKIVPVTVTYANR